jgi:hypothetical protein
MINKVKAQFLLAGKTTEYCVVYVPRFVDGVAPVKFSREVCWSLLGTWAAAFTLVFCVMGETAIFVGFEG